ncbi:hypothetical protein [Kitasatospora sp. NPDC002040]|uniref:hypothetical protein n=1 Tax=Kitasatospora sp. NPDC002040 TaxID=3154661 RepID=UPI00332A3F5C
MSTSTLTTVSSASIPETATDTTGRRRFGGRRPEPALLRFAAVLLALPPLAHLVSADLLTFLVLWVAAAALIRSRATAFDRLMISGTALIGWTCALGILASRWPWGLHPVALAEATAVLLIAIRAVHRPEPTASRPSFGTAVRRLVPVRDHPLLLTGGLTVAFFLYPLLRLTDVGRIATVIPAEDLGRHAALYDTLLRIGGLASLHQGDAATSLQTGMATYPQGSHLTLATVTTFLTGGTVPSGSIAELALFALLNSLVTAGLGVAVLWAVHRAAGPALRGWRSLVLLLPTAALLLVLELPQMQVRGFLSEIFALGLLAVLVGLAIRPLSRTREQIVVLGALTVGISFGHYLLLPAAGIVVLAWTAVHRRTWRAHWVLLLLTGAATGALALFPVYANLAQAGEAEVLTYPGAIVPVGRNLLFPLVAVALCGLLSKGSRANRPRRIALLSGSATAALAFVVMEYQLKSTGGTSYFYEKLLHQLLVVGLICFAAALLPLLGRRPVAGEHRGAGPSRPALLRLRSGATVLVATGCAVFAVLSSGQPGRGAEGGWATSAGRGLLRNDYDRTDIAQRIAAIEAARPDHDQLLTISLAGSRAYSEPNDWGSAQDNLWLSVLGQDQGRTWKAWAWGLYPRTPKEIVEYAAASPQPVRFFLDDPELLAKVKELAAGRPDPRLELYLIKPAGPGKRVAEQVAVR